MIAPVHKETTQNRKLMKNTNEVEGQRFVRFIAAYIKLNWISLLKLKGYLRFFLHQTFSSLPTVRVCNMGDTYDLHWCLNAIFYCLNTSSSQFCEKDFFTICYYSTTLNWDMFWCSSMRSNNQVTLLLPNHKVIENPHLYSKVATIREWATRTRREF